jgi:hypothetical protein
MTWVLFFQLQSNYAGDFRSILRCVFQLNATQDEADAVDGGAADEAGDTTELTGAVLAAAELQLPAEQVIPPVDLATDALHHELGIVKQLKHIDEK